MIFAANARSHPENEHTKIAAATIARSREENCRLEMWNTETNNGAA